MGVTVGGKWFRRLELPFMLGLTVAGLVSCSGDLSLGQSVWTDSFEQAPALTADVLFVVDNSQSMQGEGQEQDRVVQAFSDFIDNISENTSDFHIGVTTTDMQEGGADGKLISGQDSAQNSYLYITSAMEPSLYQVVFEDMIANLGSGAGFEKGLWAAKAALYPTTEGGNSGPSGYNAGFLRENAKLAIIFVSDEDDCSDEGDPLPGKDQVECYQDYSQLRPVYEYVADYLSLKNSDSDVVVSAIVGLQNVEPTSECGQNTTPGSRYIEAVHDLGGVVGDICQSEFSTILSQMGLNAGGIRTHFVLSRTPDESTLQVLIDDVDVPQSAGWAYDPETNALDFYGDAIPPRGSTVVIHYKLSTG